MTGRSCRERTCRSSVVGRDRGAAPAAGVFAPRGKRTAAHPGGGAAACCGAFVASGGYLPCFFFSTTAAAGSSTRNVNDSVMNSSTVSLSCPAYPSEKSFPTASS